MNRPEHLEAWLEASTALSPGQWEHRPWSLRWEEDSVSVELDGLRLEPEELVLQLSRSRLSAPPGLLSAIVGAPERHFLQLQLRERAAMGRSLALSAELAEDDALLQTAFYQGLARLSQDGEAVDVSTLLSFLRVWARLELPLTSGQAPELFRPLPLPDPLDAERAYAIWAPDESPWSAWTKPAPFVSMKTTPLHKLGKQARRPMDKKLPSEFDVSASGIGQEPGTPDSSLTFDDVLRRDRALLVDFSGGLAVRLGVRFARTGHRPVPLFNACVGPSNFPSLVNADEVQRLLLAATPSLARCRIEDDAPPVFLLDFGRDGARRRPKPHDYDNRWVLLPQDLPSAQRLMQAGIKELWLLSEKLKDDVQHVLYRYQRDGLVLRHCWVESWLGHGVQLSSPRPLELKRPSGFGWIWYRMKVLAGLKRNAAGGFGAVIPVPSNSSG